MFTTLITETGPNRGFPVTGLITLLVAVAIFYPIQKKVRAVASRRRRERWAQAGLLADEGGGEADGDAGEAGRPDGPDAESPSATDQGRPSPSSTRPPPDDERA